MISVSVARGDRSDEANQAAEVTTGADARAKLAAGRRDECGPAMGMVGETGRGGERETQEVRVASGGVGLCGGRAGEVGCEVCFVLEFCGKWGELRKGV